MVAILNIWLIYAVFLCFCVLLRIKMANSLFLANVTILNGSLAILIVSRAQVRYRQFPEPPSRSTFTGFAFPVRGHAQELLGSSQSLLCYPGVVGILDDFTSWHRAIS